MMLSLSIILHNSQTIFDKVLKIIITFSAYHYFVIFAFVANHETVRAHLSYLLNIIFEGFAN